MKIFLLVFIVGQCINQGVSFTCNIWNGGAYIKPQDCSRESI